MILFDLNLFSGLSFWYFHPTPNILWIFNKRVSHISQNECFSYLQAFTQRLSLPKNMPIYTLSLIWCNFFQELLRCYNCVTFESKGCFSGPLVLSSCSLCLCVDFIWSVLNVKHIGNIISQQLEFESDCTIWLIQNKRQGHNWEMCGRVITRPSSLFK